MWFSLVGFKVGWINHSITNQHITLLKLPILNITFVCYGMNVFGMHYTCLFQQSSFPLWPGHDLLSTFVALAMAWWYLEGWTASKAWSKLMPRNADNLELVFLAGSATTTVCVLFVVALSCGRSYQYWTIRMGKIASLLVTWSSKHTHWLDMCTPPRSISANEGSKEVHQRRNHIEQATWTGYP